MAFEYFKTNNMLFFFILALIISNMNSQLEPKCSLNSVNYSIVANLSEYLENEKNIDGREIYKEPVIDQLKTKKIGTTKELEFDRSKFDNIEEYDSLDDLIKDLQSRKLDAIVLNEGHSNKTQFLTDDLSRIEKPVDIIRYAFGFQKDNKTLVESFNEFLEIPVDRDKEMERWKGINYGIKSIEDEKKSLTGENGTINVLFRIKNEPFAYKDKNGDITGLEVLIIYNFAKAYGFGINLKEANTYEELIESLTNKSVDVVGGLLPIKEEYKKDISYSNIIFRSVNHIVVRNENLNDSLTWSEPYESPDDLDGETLGVLKGSNLEELTKEKFPESTLIEKNITFDLFEYLMMDQFEGFIMDRPSAEYFKSEYPDRITYFTESYYDSEYGFAFQKNDKGNKLKTDFNDYLGSVDFKEIYNKWNVEKTSDLTIDKELDDKNELIKAAFLPDVKPLSFQENGEMKGAEIELLYKFAKEKNYNINLTTIYEIEQRISYIEDGKANITGGWFTITDERKEKVDFSDSFFTAGTVMVVRKDSKKDEIAIKVLDDKYNPKKNNNADILVKFPKRKTNSSCVFPEKYNETITINCTISDLKDIDPYNEGFEYVNSSDKISITYSKLDVGNFIRADSKLPGHKIITESDKSKKICNGTSPSPSPSPSTTPSTTPSPSDDNRTLYYQRKKSSSGLSTGGIIAIMIPCGLVLLGAAGFALMNSGGTPAALAQYNDSELKTVTRQNLPLNPYEIQQPVKVVQQGETVQAVQPVQAVQDVNVAP